MSPRREADLDASDTFLPMVVGAISAIHRLDRLLDLVPPVRDDIESPRLDAEGRATVHLLLGVIALRDRLRAHLESGTRPAGDASPAGPASLSSPTPRLDLFR